MANRRELYATNADMLGRLNARLADDILQSDRSATWSSISSRTWHFPSALIGVGPVEASL